MATSQTVKVLLVEDSTEDAQVIQEVLKDDQDVTYDITWVETLEAGLVQLGQQATEVVLLDLRLPDSQGLDTLAKMHQRYPAVPVVVLTASDEEWIATKAMQAGAQDYLVKGYVQVYPNLLQRAMRYAMERKSSDEGNRRNQHELQQLSSTVVDREQRIVALQAEVNVLLNALNRPPKYL